MPIWVRRHPRSEFSQDAATRAQPFDPAPIIPALGFAERTLPRRLSWPSAVPFIQDFSFDVGPEVYEGAYEAFFARPPRRQRLHTHSVFDDGWLFRANQYNPATLLHQFWGVPPRRQRLHTNTVFDDGWLVKAQPPPFDTTLDAAWYLFWSAPPRRQRLYPSTVPDDGWLTVNVPPPPPVQFVGGWVQQGPIIVRRPPRVWASGMIPSEKEPGT